MKRRLWLALFLLAIVAPSLAQETNKGLPVAVQDEATAVRIAERALAKIYGKRQIESEKPFSGSLAEGVWHVTGTLRCKDEHRKVIIGACVGGVAMADIRQSDGRVLKTGHTL